MFSEVLINFSYVHTEYGSFVNNAKNITAVPFAFDLVDQVVCESSLILRGSNFLQPCPIR